MEIKSGLKPYEIRKRTYEYALGVIKFADTLPRDHVSFAIVKQLIRSGTSVGANVAEAYAASSKKDFANFYNHALKSTNESKYWLSLLRDSGRVQGEKVSAILNESDELSRILAACIVKLRSKKRE